MPVIAPIQSSQILEAKHLIYRVAFPIFHAEMPAAEAISYYERHWPLEDLDDVEQAYLRKGGAFFVMTVDERVIGTGAYLRMEEALVCELKRLWFLPQFHGQGLGYQMMGSLLESARANGYRKARLATSPGYQQRAYAFYRQVGFYDIPCFNEDPEDIGMEMDL